METFEENIGMNLKLLSLAAAVSLLASGLTYADGPSFYGRVDAAIQKSDKETGTAANAWELLSNDSRFGVKGAQVLDPDNASTTAFYQFEWDVDVAGSASSTTQSDVLKRRNQFGGLHSDALGDVLLGYMDTPLKASQGSVDVFNDHAGDMKNLFGATASAFGKNSGEQRQTNSLAYKSPKFVDGSLQVSVLVSPGENVNVDGNAGTEKGLADSSSASIIYDKDGVYGAVAYDSAVQNWDHVRLVGGVKVGDAQLGGIYQTGKDSASATDLKTDGYMLSVAYNLFDGSLVLKGEYGANKEKTAGATTADRDLVGVGVEHKFTKQAKVYAEYVQFNESVADTTDSYLTLGTQVTF